MTHLSSDDDDDTIDESRMATPTAADALVRLRYTLSPTLYVDENSTVEDLLWQQVLELRAIRTWLIVTLVVSITIAVIIFVTSS